MAKKRNREFWESARNNDMAFRKYYNRLSELAMSMFEWKNLPETIDERFLELTLFGRGAAVFFRDEVLGYLALPTMLGGELNVYRIPKRRTAYANNGYKMQLDESDSVIIFNNLLHTSSAPEIDDFAEILYDIEQSIIVNAKAQKTPILLSCTEQEKLTLKNAYMQYEGNMPVIHTYKDFDPTNAIKALNTGAPYVADRLYALKTEIWNEALTFLGISNVSFQKRERMVTDEVTRGMGGVVASRFSRLNARRQACEQINKMFGLDIWVDFREEFIELEDAQTEDTNGGEETKTEVVADE